MNDLDLLRQYSQEGSQKAFSILVSRYIDLVYSAARRQVGSPDFASEVAQTVFLELAENARRIQPDTHLASWLYVASRRRAIDLVRRETSRQRREQTALEVSAMKSAGAPWSELEPLLDEAMASLNGADRQAILLRFFENKSLDDVGRVLGCSEGATQKRVSRAIDRLHLYFTKRGLVTAAAALATVLSVHAVQPAPGGLSSAIVSAVSAQGTAGAVVAHQALRTFAATAWSKALVALLAVTIGYVGYQFYVLYGQQREIAVLENRLGQLKTQAVRLNAERDQARARATAAAAVLNSGDAEFDARVKEVLARIAQVKRGFQEVPAQQIPELGFLSDSDWFGVIQEQAKWKTGEDIQAALSSVRTRAKNRFLPLMQEALKNFLKSSQGVLPSSVAQLAPYFKNPVDPAVLARYEMLRAGSVSELERGENLIGDKAANVINPRYDNLGVLSLASIGMRMLQPPEQEVLMDAARQAVKGYRAAHDGKDPEGESSELLLPYFANAEVGAAFLQLQAAITNPLRFSRNSAWNEAMQLYRAAHHGAYPAKQEELGPYFQNPDDAAKYILAIKEGRWKP